MKKFAMAVAVVALVAFSAPAFAALNPFMDVPASHWAYDAVAQLAARGVISGYPDGTYKGAKPTTRYEMASALARALAVIDMEKASKQDVEMLKRLVVEFKDELDALGVKVDSIDSRLAVMEKDLGGWRIYGQFRFDAKWANNPGDHGITGKSDFTLSRFRVFLQKRINETTTFTARLGQAAERSGVTNSARFEQYYVTTKLPYDITLIVGKQSVDYEGDLGLYWNDAAYNTSNLNAFRFIKDWGKANFDLFVTRINDGAGIPTEAPDPTTAAGLLAPFGYEKYFAGMKFTYDLSENFQFALLGYYSASTGDEMKVNNVEYNVSAWSLHPVIRYRFDNGVTLRAFYGYQKQGSWFKNAANALGLGNGEDKANEWGVLLDVPQSVLKFTRLRADYRSFDNNFYYYQTGDNAGGVYDFGTNIFDYVPWNNQRSKQWAIRLDQKWSDKWETFAHYINLNIDTNNLDDIKQWAIGARYNLNPAMYFQLMYESIDAGNNAGDEKDNMIRFRTFVSF